LFAFGEPQVKGRDDLAVDLHSTVIGSHRYADSGGREAAQVVFEPSDLRSGRRAALTDGVLNAPDKGREALSNIDLRGACLECLGVQVRQDQSRLGGLRRRPYQNLGPDVRVWERMIGSSSKPTPPITRTQSMTYWIR